MRCVKDWSWTMLVIVYVLTALGAVIAEDRPTGYMFSTTSVFNLDLKETTSYTIGCSLNGPTNYSSIHLVMYADSSEAMNTKVINDTTIAYDEYLQVSDKPTGCHEIDNECWYENGSYQVFIGNQTIYYGRPPPVIKPRDFKCISHDRDFLTCSFKRKNSCGLHTNYKIRMNTVDSQWGDCNFTDTGSTLIVNTTSCALPFEFYFKPERKKIAFQIDIENGLGSTTVTINVLHNDIVRPAAPKDLLGFVNSTSIQAFWKMTLAIMIEHLDRMIEFEFLMISKYGKSNSSMRIASEKMEYRMEHMFNDLYAFTWYELKIRARVIPRSVRLFEEKYWSDWSSIRVRTKACRPYQAPRTAPGAFSFKERRDKLATVEVYWEPVPKYLHNGPRFGYDVFAVSESGQRFNVSHPVNPNGAATFRDMKVDERYTVHLYSFNNKGRSENASHLFIYPSEVANDPKIKRVLLNDSYHLQWFPVGKPEHLSNYTVMHCTFSATDSCQNSIQIVTLPPNATSYSINSTKTPNFALAANYQFYSSKLSWMQCIVQTPSNINPLAFNLTDVTEHSVTLRLSLSCPDQSLIERYEVRYWPKMDTSLVKNMTKRSYDMVMPIDGLEKDTEYVVNVTAYDENGILNKDSQSVHTKDKDILLQLILFLLFGILVIAIVTTIATRRVKKMMIIKVEIPLGLEEIFETATNSSQCEGPYHVNTENETTQSFSDFLENDELLPISQCNQNQPDDAVQSDLAVSILNQPDEVHDEHPCLPEQSEEQMPYNQDDPDDKNKPMKIKSILKKPDEAVHNKHVCLPEQLEMQKTIQILTTTDYIQPSQMKDHEKQDLNGIRSSGWSEYVDANLLINQQNDR